MKKILIAMILIIAQLIPGLATVTRAEEKTAVPITVDADYQAFKWLGMTTSEMDKLSADDYVTRGQFAYVLAGIMGYRTKKVVDSDIIDVQGTVYEGAIDFLVKRKIMPTMPVNKFNPKDAILYKEMLTAAVTALGYMNVQYNITQDVDAYIQKIASETDLTKGMNVKQNESPSAADTFRFLKRLALTSVFEVDGFTGNKVNYTNKTGRSLIYLYSRISYSEGTVMQNGITSIGGTEITSGNAKIGDITVSTDKFPDIEKLIGRTVEFFYEDDDSYGALLYANTIEKKNEIVEIRAEDLETHDTEFSINCIVYNDNGRIRNLKTSLTADVIYNGVRIDVPTSDDLAIKQGTVTAIDSNKDGDFDVIDITEYEDYEIRGRAENVLLLNGKSYDMNNFSYVRIYNSDGELVEDFSGLNASAVVSVFASKDEGTYLKVVESLATESVTVIGTNTEDGKTTYLTNDKAYTLSETFRKNIVDNVPGMAYPVAGKTYLFKLNFENRVVAITELYQGQWQIAYCVGIYGSADNDDGISIKLVMPDNSVFTPYFADRVIINGVKIRSDELIQNASIYQCFVDAGGNPIRQPVHIKISKDGEVCDIETPVDRTDSPYGYDKTVFSKDAHFETGAYKGGNHHGIGMYTIRTNGVVIEDPYLGEPDKYKTKDVTIKTVANVAEGRMSECYIYDVDEAYVGEILVYKNNEESLEETQTLALIDKVTYIYDEDAKDELSRMVSFFTQNGDELNLKVKKEDTLPDDVKRGDVYKIAYSGGIISGAKKIVALADDPEPFASADVVDQKWADIFGYVYAACSDSVTVLKPDGYTATPQKLIGTALKGGTVALVYDLPNDDVYVGSWEDMITSDIPDENGNITIDSHSTKVYIYRRWDYANGLIILKR